MLNPLRYQYLDLFLHVNAISALHPRQSYQLQKLGTIKKNIPCFFFIFMSFYSNADKLQVSALFLL